MGRSGPAPNPTALRALNGDHPCRINDDEPRPRTGVPQPPEWFTGQWLDLWHRTLGELTAMGLARPVDEHMLAAYCVAVVKWSNASQILFREGLVIRTSTTTKPHPAAAIASAASLEMARLAREFGFTPAARVGITVAASSAGASSGADPERLLG